MKSAPDLAAIRAAATRIAPFIHQTPVLSSASIDALAGGRILFQCENFQKTGSFKARGAFNAIFSLGAEEAGRGVATQSSGNHGAAVALAAKTRGIPAHVVMPETAPAVKRAAVEGYGAIVHRSGPTLAEREAVLAQVLRDTGATYVPPYDDPRVIAGQGSWLLQFLEQRRVATPAPDLVLCPVGGGGLLAGTALVARALLPGARVVAAEPQDADDAARGFHDGRRQPQRVPVTTIADGLTTALSELTFDLMRRNVDDVVTVSEQAIVSAMRLLWTRMKIVVEPSSAVPLAAILERRVEVAGRTVAIILTGGNVDLDHLPW